MDLRDVGQQGDDVNVPNLATGGNAEPQVRESDAASFQFGNGARIIKFGPTYTNRFVQISHTSADVRTIPKYTAWDTTTPGPHGIRWRRTHSAGLGSQ